MPKQMYTGIYGRARTIAHFVIIAYLPPIYFIRRKPQRYLNNMVNLKDFYDFNKNIWNMVLVKVLFISIKMTSLY